MWNGKHIFLSHQGEAGATIHLSQGPAGRPPLAPPAVCISPGGAGPRPVFSAKRNKNGRRRRREREKENVNKNASLSSSLTK